ncbi:hypothetical protein HHI36_020843 [Cryptolaemus montrouzieri]
MRSKLQEDLELVTEKYELLNTRYNKLALAERQYKKKMEEMKVKSEESPHPKSPTDTGEGISSRCQELERENSQLKEDIALLKEKMVVQETEANKADVSEVESLSEREGSIVLLSEYEERIKSLEDELGIMKVKNGQYEERVLELEERDRVKSGDLHKLEEYETKIKGLVDEVKQLQKENTRNCSELCETKKELADLTKHNAGMDAALRSRFENYLSLEDGSVSFSESLKIISDSLLDLETKCSLLQSRLDDRDEELEKLLQNNEILSQQLSKKSEVVREWEEECLQLRKNNDLLINKLEELRETGLQTIFESNEDNVVSLEKQLECACEKICELEKSLSDPGRRTDCVGKLYETLQEDLGMLQGEVGIEESLKDKVSQMKVNLETLWEEIGRLDSTSIENGGCLCREQELKALEAELCAFKKNNESLEETLRVLETKLADSRMEIAELQEKCLGNEEIDTLEKKLANSDEMIEHLQETAQLLRSKLGDRKKEIECLERRCMENEEEMRSLEGKLASSNGMVENLQGNLEDLQSTLSAREKEIEYYDQRCLESKEKVELLEEELRSSNGTITGLRKTLEELERKLEEREVEIEGTKGERLEICKLKSELENSRSSLAKVQDDYEKLLMDKEALTNVYSELGLEKCEVTEIVAHIRSLRNQMEMQDKSHSEQDITNLQKQLDEIQESRNQLIALLQTKHQENVAYHAEIQRLSEILKGQTEKNALLEQRVMELGSSADDLEKLTDQVGFLREKCDVLTQTMLEERSKAESERSSSAEREAALVKKLERLQSHLIEVEESYSQELLQSEQKVVQLQARLNEVEQREKDCSNVYTSVSIRANQQNEALQQQLQSMTGQRDEFKRKVLELEDENSVKSAALSNLQLVLEQFQRDREADVVRETDRIRRQIKQEQKVQEDLRKEIVNLELQMKESKQGLHAASRLTDQLEMSKKQISSLKEEVMALTDKLNKKEEMLEKVTSQTEGKVDKSLIKNLIIGFITSNKNINKDQSQILKIIATVLDFNEQDHKKVNLNQANQNNWLNYVLHPTLDDLPPNESLSRAFVNFLENESKPKIIPSLLPTTTASNDTTASSSNSSTRSTPIVLNEIVLPTFTDFPQHRNSSSILKGVLKDSIP